jgi:hypothetical protein
MSDPVRVAIPVEMITREGLNPEDTETAPDDTLGAKFNNDGRTMLWARNSGEGSHDVTIKVSIKALEFGVADLAVTIPDGEIRLIGPFPKYVFNQHSVGGSPYVHVDADGTQSEMLYKALRL